MEERVNCSRTTPPSSFCRAKHSKSIPAREQHRQVCEFSTKSYQSWIDSIEGKKIVVSLEAKRKLEWTSIQGFFAIDNPSVGTRISQAMKQGISICSFLWGPSREIKPQHVASILSSHLLLFWSWNWRSLRHARGKRLTACSYSLGLESTLPCLTFASSLAIGWYLLRRLLLEILVLVSNGICRAVRTYRLTLRLHWRSWICASWRLWLVRPCCLGGHRQI